MNAAGHDVPHAPDDATGWRTLPLAPGGRSLIEASAGTGKPWTIAALDLRLLLDQQLSPRHIVETTFTDAAAGELRDRIRRQLVASERFGRGLLEAAAPTDEAEADDRRWLRERWTATGADAPGLRSDLQRLRLAVAELDLAPIGTLHTLCRRILADFPFESGSAFGPRELVSADGLVASLAQDVWRHLRQSGDDATMPRPDCRSPAEVARRLRAYLAPGVSMQVRALGEEPRIALSRDIVGPIRALLERKVFRKGVSKLPKALKALADFVAAGAGEGAVPPTVANLVPVPVTDQIAIDFEHDPHVQQVLAFAADAARQLQARADHRTLATERQQIEDWAHWVEQARRWRRQRLAAASQLTFDELIDAVHVALAPGGSALADRLHAAFPVALVDEFQDTDALQYGILDRIHRDSDGNPRGRLVMIGDPKQAIYRFRGGDIHAYLAARRHAGASLALAVNQRSSTELVAAVNAFYALAGAQLGTTPEQAIGYTPVHPGRRADATPYRIDGQPCAQPLQFHYWPDCPDPGAQRRDWALEACANQIAGMLAGGSHTLGDKPLEPGDIAVLVPTNADIRRLAALLRRRRVPVVSAAKSSVFASDWARELQIVLYAAHHARDEGAVRAALATRLGGVGFDQLRALHDDPGAWQRHAARFATLGQLWRTRGVLALVQDVVAHAGARLLAAGDGERSLTDLRHLGELLQEASATLSGPEELLGWLANEREDHDADDGDAGEDRQQRLESDARRVRLMTLHASKGLEFPVVMLPLMWVGASLREDIVLLHDDATGARVPGLGAADRQRYAQEGQDERFRLLYVALTRASHACHVFVLPPHRPSGRAGKPETDPRRSALDAMVARMFPRLVDGELPAVAHAHIGWSNDGWPWGYTALAARAPAPARQAVLPPPRNAPFEFKWSFSSLTGAGRSLQEEDAARDEGLAQDVDDLAFALAEAGEAPAPDLAIAADESPHPELVALAPIAGAEFGNALHAMFELREVGRPMAAQLDLVRQQLLHSGVRLGDLDPETLVARLARRVQATLDTPLALADGHVVRLGALAPHQLRAEMAFDYVLDGVGLDRLRQACRDAGEPDLVPRTSMRQLRGLMTGKIDLVFEHDGRYFVLDYKGNLLGRLTGGEGRVSSYAAAPLREAMDASHYRFQALLYVVAVDRYLRQRIGAGYDRARQLGEAVYLFVRAVGLAPGAGVWSHRFSDELIDAVQAVLGEPAEQGA
jgi:exodeoxyribonuclease V beta subunit